MTQSERWARIESVYHAALALPPDGRAEFVALECAGDAALRAEVESLLAQGTGGQMPAAAAAAVVANAMTRQARVGQQIGPYVITATIGAGGMGEVYEAQDTRLGRTVAIKFIVGPMSHAPLRRERFFREARSISALNHPHICTLYDVGRENGVDFLVLEYVDGETLANRLARGTVPVADAIRITIELTDALSTAHRQHLIHRDIKPGNIMLTNRGGSKILDFGIAKTIARSTGSESEATGLTLTAVDGVVGTGPYMSPEQIRGEPLDHRSDLYSLGIVLHEMVTGSRSFTRNSSAVPAVLRPVIDRLLQDDRALRYQSADEARRDLAALVIEAPRPMRWALALTVVAALATGGWVWHRVRLEHWATQTAPKEIGQLVDAGEFARAAQLAGQALMIVPADPTLQRLWRATTQPASFATAPAGAAVSIRPYGDVSAPWKPVGETPLSGLRIPLGVYLCRLSKPGFATILVLAGEARATPAGNHPLFDIPAFRVDYTLRSERGVPPEMVVVPMDRQGRRVGLEWPSVGAPFVSIDDFLIDRHEVTNEEFKRFVDAGGYRRSELWTEPFERNGRDLSFAEAVGEFTDSTGRPGPSSWEAGSYPKGMEQYPVAGISWFEAAAYARFAGKSLPTVYHWTRASQAFQYAGLIAEGGNFSSRGTHQVGEVGTTSGFGTVDMAGNVKEWCLNASAGGGRFALGGGFGDPQYKFDFTDTADPWTRRANFGVRCVKLDGPPSALATATIDEPSAHSVQSQPASIEAFNAYKALYMYDKVALDARVEETERTKDWIRERVSLAAAYGNDRVTAHVFMPVAITTPVQAVVLFPGGFAMLDDHVPLGDIEDSMGFVMKSGRALVVPIYKGTYERRDELVPRDQTERPSVFRDHVIMWSKDLGRSVDYLETRKDIDAGRIAYYGYSLGAKLAPVFLTVDHRFKAAVLDSGGFAPYHYPQEIQPLNFITRLTVPVLMMNGRYDYDFPLESSQKPFFDLLGTAANEKQHIVFEAQHGEIPPLDRIRETLRWLDKYLGGVRR